MTSAVFYKRQQQKFIPGGISSFCRQRAKVELFHLQKCELCKRGHEALGVCVCVFFLPLVFVMQASAGRRAFFFENPV